jgi:hypothetical protein
MVAWLFVSSCRSGESTAPSNAGSLPPVSPQLTVKLPSGSAIVKDTPEQITIVAVNLKPQSCRVTGPFWLTLIASADSNSTWTATAGSTGWAHIATACQDMRGGALTETDSLIVYPKPTLTPDITGPVPLAVGDSLDISYDSTATPKVDVTCENCAPYASVARVAANTVRFYGRQLPAAGDTTHRGVCFTARGMDGNYTLQSCVTMTILRADTSLFTIPLAIRQAETVSLHPIPVATYDSTGQSNHPDFMRVNAAWAGGACWMSFTPYFGSNGAVENPSVATSPDCEHWTPAPGVPAPLVGKPVNGYNSDPELMYDGVRGCLGVVFRQVFNVNSIQLTSTCDGATWSAPRELFSAPNHSAVSPSVTIDDAGIVRAFYVDAHTGCSTETSAVKTRTATSQYPSLDSVQFGSESTTDLAQPGYVIWHIKVRYIPEQHQYWAMYAAFPQTAGPGDCTDDDLFLATSADGMHWTTFATPFLNHLDRRYTFTSMYRASFQYDAATDQVRTIVSALSGTDWGQFGVAHNRKTLMAALTSSQTATAAQLVASQKLVRTPGKSVKKVIAEDRP